MNLNNENIILFSNMISLEMSKYLNITILKNGLEFNSIKYLSSNRV